ncbi:envelope-like protein [Cucumis melo var. makuwa]|uniref:Envelope-like protein n=1 Tax=Cucumis melo var. makuwa TaxID=1194695 RepID=A0A5D3DYL7_CUCMM|nr:envelope-like protein [Cucumis melo var. makuwa]
MVNTRKGTYASKSSVEVHEVSSPKGAMHGVRMCGRQFKSTPPRRPYRISFEKSQTDTFKSPHKHVQEEVGYGGNAKIRTSASEARLSNMNSDDLDDVPLARLLKKALVPDVVTEQPTDPVLSLHSQEISSSEGVFIPTHGLHHNSIVEPGPYLYSSPVRSSISDETTTIDLKNVPAHVPVDESVETKGRTDDCDREPPTADDNVAEHVDIDGHNDEVPVAFY